MSLRKKLIVAIDVDEVLAGFLDGMCKYHNETYNTSLTIGDFHSYEFHEVWGGSKEEAGKKVAEFFETKYFANLEVVEGADKGLAFIQEHPEIESHIVTSRQSVLRDQTIDWLAKSFPEFSYGTIHLGNHYGEGKKRSKSEICAEIGAHVLIDDSWKYIHDVCSNGIKKGILFDLNGGYGWNKTEENPTPEDEFETAVRVTSWEGVIDEVGKVLEEVQ